MEGHSKKAAGSLGERSQEKESLLQLDFGPLVSGEL